jgi:hypothetical protein
MRIELNFYKDSGKWYTTEEIDVSYISLVDDYPCYKDMDYTVHIIEEDGHKQPYRLYKR